MKNLSLLDHMTQERKEANYVSMQSKKNEIGFCFKISVKNNQCFVHVLTGGFSEKSFTYLGRFFIGANTFLFTPDAKGTIEQKAFSYLFKHSKNESLLDQNYIISRKFKRIVY